jgi:peptidyl-prolyl cis-trans isomerase SurA
LLACAISGAQAQNAVVVVNGDPITNLDIEQRQRFLQLATHKNASRQEAIDDLIEEKLKLQLLKRYEVDPNSLNTEVDSAISSRARSMHMTSQQFAQVLAQQGVPMASYKSRLKAELVWTQVIRGKYQASLQLNDNEITKALESRNKEDTAGYDYTLRPIVFVVPRGAAPSVIDSQRRIAEGLRNRFESCETGLPFARSLGAVVREQVLRSSADLPAQLRDLLEKTEIGHITAPEVTPEGVQVYAICAKKVSSKDNTVGRREVRNEVYAKVFEAKSKEYMKELRDRAYIIYNK